MFATAEAGITELEDAARGSLNLHRDRLVRLAEHTDHADEIAATLDHEPGPEDEPYRDDGEPFPADVLATFARGLRIGAHSRVIRELAQHFENTAGIAGLADRIASQLEHAADATPAALNDRVYGLPPDIPDVAQYHVAVVAAHERAISELEDAAPDSSR